MRDVALNNDGTGLDGGHPYVSFRALASLFAAAAARMSALNASSSISSPS